MKPAHFLLFSSVIVNFQAIYGWYNRDFTNFETDTTKYDFIIVGSGSAGSVVANRLSENPKWNVLLLEVGKEPTSLVDIPALCGHWQFTDYNWGYLPEEQDNVCLGCKDKRMAWPRGRALGGSSIINYMIHVRGNRHDYDDWATSGNTGWSYDQVLPYFKKSEDCLVKNQDFAYRNSGGNLGVQEVHYKSKSSSVFIEAMQEFGYKYVDYNGKNQIGVSYIQGTLRGGRRSSALRAFLDPVRHRKNLRIITEARVTKILIDPETKTAYGVELVKNNKRYIARASKEVVLSAGALSSPQLLILSGIGPKEHLEELGIPLIQDLPVGKKQYDHLGLQGLMFTVNETIIFDLFQENTLKAIANFYKTGSGPMTSLGGVEALAIVKTNVSGDPRVDYPDVEFIFAGGGMQVDGGLVYRNTVRVVQSVYDAIIKPFEKRPAFNVLVMPYHPKSYGRMELKSKNPLHRPKFYGNYFTDPRGDDMRTMIAGIRMLQEIIKMPAFRKYDTKLSDIPLPGCRHLPFDSDAYWECFARHLSVSVHHQVATNKMGPSSDPEAVVSPQLLVHGVKNLRVVDTSIIPGPISAHTNVPAYMIGEKASDLIKTSYL